MNRVHCSTVGSRHEPAGRPLAGSRGSWCRPGPHKRGGSRCNPSRGTIQPGRAARGAEGAPVTAAVILPIDPTLPHLRQALDARSMAAVFGQALRARGALRLEDCRVDRIKYRPRRNCHVSYVLRLRDAQGDNMIEQRVVARFCAGGDAARRYSKAYPNALHPTPAGPMLLHLPELDALVHWWPNDAKLSAPSLLADDARLRAVCLPEVVAGLSAGRGHLIEHRTAVVQYVPEHRLSACIDLHLQPGPDASPVWRRVYAKADSERRGADTHAVMQALSASRAQQAG